MWIRDELLSAPLGLLGKPRIIEVAVPLAETGRSDRAGLAVIRTFARSRGSIPEKGAFDLFVEKPLPAAAILTIHSEGEPSFDQMGRGYPAAFVDVDIGRWKELTGEDG